MMINAAGYVNTNYGYLGVTTYIVPGDAHGGYVDRDADGKYWIAGFNDVSGAYDMVLVKLKSSNNVSTGNTLELGNDRLVVYPNPAMSRTTIELLLANTRHVSAQIMTLDGRIVESFLSGATLRPGAYNFELDVSHLDSGIYLVQVTTEAGTMTGKLLKTE